MQNVSLRSQVSQSIMALWQCGLIANGRNRESRFFLCKKYELLHLLYRATYVRTIYIILKTTKPTCTSEAFAYPPMVMGTENSAMKTGSVPSLPGNTKSNSDHSSFKLFCIVEPDRMIR